MATTIEKYVDGCNAIYEAKPTYVKGASDLSQCDCIGMDKYSFRVNKVSFSTTGTNWSFRNQVENIRAIHSEADLKVGDVCFKAYEPGESGYDLPAKYQPGGSGYNGDLRDYYHIGTVRSVNPLEIIHMTSPTAKMDTTLNKKGWDFVANWKKEYISDSPEPIPPEPTPPEPPVPPAPEPDTAVVYAENGGPVKMRQKPSTSCRMYWEVPSGTTVEVLEWGNEWSHIKAFAEGALRTGYMMSKFLLRSDPPVGGEYTVHIPGLTQEQAQNLTAQYPGAWITEDGAVG